MPTSLKWRTAEQLFRKGLTLYEEKRYEQALIELGRAEEAFRKIDARGHPVGYTLQNGVSGLANAFALLGRCHQELGKYHEGIVCYENSLINEKFEKAKSFQIFFTTLRNNLIVCYEKELETLSEQMRRDILEQDAEIDTSLRFPFSLGKNALLFARLYELAPDSHPHCKDFYLRSKRRDSEKRQEAGEDRDDAKMKRATVSIWLVLGALWMIYSMIVVRALVHK
jgi:tetratricopeptide (TPR) repeat protein